MHSIVYFLNWCVLSQSASGLFFKFQIFIKIKAVKRCEVSFGVSARRISFAVPSSCSKISALRRRPL